MKKCLLLLSFALLFSCTGNATSSYYYDETFSGDLNILLDSSPSQYNDTYPFNAIGYIAPSYEYDGKSIITLDISYKDTTINNIKIMVVPFKMNSESEVSSIANVGYGEYSFTLDRIQDPEERVFNGYRISYLTSDASDGMKVSLKGNEETYLFSFSRDTLIEK